MSLIFRLMTILAITLAAQSAQAVPRTYYQYFNTGTVLSQPAVTTNVTCPAAADIVMAVPGISLLADAKDATCVPAVNRDVRWTTASSLTLYYNGAGYATPMNVTGTSVGVRARGVVAGSILTAKLFYTTTTGARVDFVGTPGSVAVTAARVDYTISLAGMSATSVPAGAKLGVEFSWTNATGMRLSLNLSANNDKLIVDEVSAGPAVPEVMSINCSASCTTNASSASWAVTFSESVTGVTSGNFSLVNTGLGGSPAITSVTGSGANWTVTASTGMGSGTLGLDMVNSTGLTPALTNLPFSGQSHTLDRTAPFALSIARADASPTALASVSWTVTFDESVSGVDAGDFALVQSGGISGAAITGVTGSGTTYTVMAGTGVGSGLLGLSLIDDDSIVDGAGNPLGETGAGNGDFSGESYSVAKPVTITASPTACVSVAGTGTIAWTTLTGPLASDNSRATASVSDFQITDYLQCTGYGFAIPAGATIGGITVNAERSASATGVIRDQAMRLVRDAAGAPAIQATDRSTTTFYTLADVVEAHGGATDLWGATWTADDINNPNFGAALASVKASAAGGGRTARVDHISITVDYTPSPAAVPHHLEILHDSGAGVTCTPSTLTIRACADSACATPYTDGVTGSLGVTGTPVVMWVGGTGFTIPAGSSSVTKDVQVMEPGSVVFGAAAAPEAAAATSCNFGSPACTFTAADSGFLISVPDHAAESSQTLTITAVKKSDSTTVCAPGLTGAKTVNLKCAYVDPGSGTLPLRVAGTALNAGNDAGAACDAGGANVSLTFDASGVATPSLQYADVGEMQIDASYSDASLTMTGAGTFVSAPAAFKVDGVTAGPIKAGNAFGATISALNSLGIVAPNFGLEDVPEGVEVAFSKCQPTGVLSSNGVFSGSVGAFSGGAANATDLIWNEVGNGDLIATLMDGDYLGSGLTAAGNTGTSGVTCNGAGAGNVGPFIPDHFITEVTDGCAGCGFTYSGQPFTVTVTAMNGLATPTTTANYDGTANTTPNFANDVSLTDANAAATPVGKFGVSAAPMGVTVNPGGDVLTVPKGDFVSGVATLTNVPTYVFNVVPTAPATVKMRAVDSVTAAVTSSGFTEGTTSIRSGRIKLSNGHGSELLPLPLTATVQFFNGATWVTSATDDATSFDTNLTTAGGNLAAAVITGLTGGIAVSAPGVAPVVDGVRTFRLSPPGQAGSVNLTIGAPAYLPSNTARATFGVYKGNNEFIYLRENY